MRRLRMPITLGIAAALSLTACGTGAQNVGAVQISDSSPASRKTDAAGKTGRDEPDAISFKPDGPVALTGRVIGEETLKGADFQLSADPDPETVGELKPGDTVSQLPFPDAEFETRKNEFAVKLDIDDITDPDYINDRNIVTLSLTIRIPGKNGSDKFAYTGASVEYTGSNPGVIPWSDTRTTPGHGGEKIQPDDEVRPEFIEVTLQAPSPKNLIPRTSSPRVASAAAETPPHCSMKTFIRSADVWSNIGETYPVGDGKGGMTFTSEASAKYEGAVSFGGWSASKAVEIKSGIEGVWEPVGWPRKYLVEIRYKKYQCVYQSKDQAAVWTVWEPSGHTGGSDHVGGDEYDDYKDRVQRPDWVGMNEEDHCTKSTVDAWNRDNSAGGSESLGWEGKLTAGAKNQLEIGIELGVSREWSTSSKITYNMTKDVDRLCGMDEKPGFASKIAQYAKVAPSGTCLNVEIPEAKQVEPKAPPEQQFNEYAKKTPDGWTGGDSTYSVRLPDGRLLYIFSDTFLGPLNKDGTRPVSAPFVNNSFVIQDGTDLKTVTGGTKENPRSLMTDLDNDPTRWYWLGDGMISDVQLEGELRPTKRLQIIFHQWHRYDPDDLWGFRLEKTIVATFDLNDLTRPAHVKDIPSSPVVPRLSPTQWGAAIVPASESGDGYTYVYGIEDAPTNKRMRVARIKGTDLNKDYKWEFLNDGRKAWLGKESLGTTNLTGVANEFSVTKWGNSFVLVSQDSTEAFSQRVRLWASCNPYTGFRNNPGRDVVYMMPEVGLWGSYGDGNIFAYNAHVHRDLSSGSRWTLSYNVNSFDATVGEDGAHYRDPSIYKPRFVSFALVPSTQGVSAEVQDLIPKDSSPGVDSPCTTACRGVPQLSGR